MIRNVLVLCTGNICRSPMAAALLERGVQERGTDVTVKSAGIAAMTGYAADAHAIRLMAARNLDIQAHRAVQLDIKEALRSDLILVMSTDQRHHLESRWPLLQGRVYGLGYWDDSDIDDPYRRGDAAFKEALVKIDTGVVQWLARISA